MLRKSRKETTVPKYYSNKPLYGLTSSEFNTLISTECFCVNYDENGDILYDKNNEPQKTHECDGTCDYDFEEFEEVAMKWFVSTNHRYFIGGFPRWDGLHDGEIIANSPRDFIQKFNADFCIKWLFHREPKKKDEKNYNPIVLRLIVSSHDVPIAKWVTVEKDTKPLVEYY